MLTEPGAVVQAAFLVVRFRIMCAHCRVQFPTYVLRKTYALTRFTQSTFGLRVLEQGIVKIIFRIITCIIIIILIMGRSVPVSIAVANVNL